MAEITTTLPVYTGTIPDPDAQSQIEFDENAVAWNTHVKTLAPAQNAQAAEANALKLEINAARADTLAAQGAAEAARDIALTAPNHRGAWVNLSGGLTPPASCYHADRYWVLLNPLADVAASEPGVSADWAATAAGRSVAVQGATTLYANASTTYSITDYDSASTYSVSATRGAASLTDSSISYTAPATEGSDTLTVTVNGVPRAITLSIAAAGIEAPSLTSHSNGETGVGETPTLTTSAFSAAGASDTHAASQYRILDATGTTTIYDSGEVADLLSHSVPAGYLSVSTTYLLEARHKGTTLGWSAYSARVSVTTAASFIAVVTPTLLHPSTDPWGHLYIQGSQFATSGPKGLHVATKAEIYEGVVLVYSKEKTGEFDPSAIAGTDQIGILDDTATHVSASAASADAWKLFDGDDATFWQISATSGWIQIEPQTDRAPYPVGLNLTIRNTVSAPDQAPETLRLQGSLDGTTWLDLETWSGLTWTAAETKSLSVGTASGTGYPYLRLQIDANNGHVTTELATVELLTHTAPNPLEAVIDNAITAAVLASTSYSARIGYKMAGDADYTWSEQRAVTTASDTDAPGVIGLVLVTTGGGAGTWQRVDDDFEALSVDASYFNSHPTYEGILHELIDGQYMGRFPKFWFRAGAVPSGTYAGKTYWQISDTALAGFAVHPAFADGAGGWRDQVWVGTYQGTDDGGTKLGSQPGALPLVSLDFPTMQARAAARNINGVSGFALWDYHKLGALQMLATIEMGGADSQSLIGQGRVSASSAANTDATDVAQATWRGFVGLWGNVRQMVDGLKRNSSKWWLWTPGTQTYVNTNQADLQTSGYPVTLNNTLLAANGVLLPATINATDTNGSTGDYFYSNATTTDMIAYHGGSWSYGAYAGLLSLRVHYAPSIADTSIGARLAKV